MKPKGYVTPLTIEAESYEIDSSIWEDAKNRLAGKTKYPFRILLTYIAYKMKAPKDSLPSRVTVWRHKKIWESAGFL